MRVTLWVPSPWGQARDKWRLGPFYWQGCSVPIYEYKCGDCGRISEFFESGASRRLRKCEHCGGGKLQKRLSIFSASVKEGDSRRCLGCTDVKCPHSQR